MLGMNLTKIMLGLKAYIIIKNHYNGDFLGSGLYTLEDQNIHYRHKLLYPN